jgi:hypothetical protein
LFEAGLELPVANPVKNSATSTGLPSPPEPRPLPGAVLHGAFRHTHRIASARGASLPRAVPTAKCTAALARPPPAAVAAAAQHAVAGPAPEQRRPGKQGQQGQEGRQQSLAGSAAALDMPQASWQAAQQGRSRRMQAALSITLTISSQTRAPALSKPTYRR